MPISAPGNSCSARPAPGRGPVPRGFTLLELLVVLVIVALVSSAVVLSLRDSQTSQLEREGERLSALLEGARAQSRASGAAVTWRPGSAPDESPFRFIGLGAKPAPPTRWLDERVTAEVWGRPALVLGPDAILPAQRVVLRLGDRRLDIASDGLAPFGAVAPLAADAPALRP
jgi:general secretion pathway protein H